jgi:DICT domain-containing protein/predicted DNA-binding transcriptional regulator AlpA
VIKVVPPTRSLTIGALAQRTGVTAPTLRMWESRHGFPVPERLKSGHRRYDLSDVETILDVLRRRNGGVRLDVAIGQAVRNAMAQAEPGSPSVFAMLRQYHPHLVPHRLRKPTLLALSWAIEDEFCAKAEPGHLFAAFQRQRFFEAAHPRWAELARLSHSAFVFADFDDNVVESELVTVPLEPGAPLCREWLVVCDAPGFAVALSAWELPGQADVRDRDRLFEAMWTLDPRAVRDCARVAAQVAASAGAAEATPVLFQLAEDPVASEMEPMAATAMFNRVVAYLDRFAVS